MAGCLGSAGTGALDATEHDGSSAAPYLQYQVDAGRTGSTADKGPVDHIHRRAIDKAFTVQLPSTRAFAAPPLIIGDAVYVLTGLAGPRAYAIADEPSNYGVYRVSLATAEVELVAPIPQGSTAMASDGDRLFVAQQTGLTALDLDGEMLWNWTFPTAVPDVTQRVCAPLAVAEGTVYAACTAFANDGGHHGLGSAAETFVAAVDAESGHGHWVWTHRAQPESATNPAALYEATSTTPAYEVRRLAVAGPVLAVSLLDVDRLDTHPSGLAWVVVLDRSSGETLWARDEAGGNYGGRVPATVQMTAPGLLGTDDVLFIKGQEMEAMRTTSETQLWVRWDLSSYDPSTPVDIQEPYGAFQWLGNKMGLTETTLLVTHDGVLFALESLDGQTRWQETHRPSGASDFENAEGILVAGGLAYVTTYVHYLVAYDLASHALVVGQPLAYQPPEVTAAAAYGRHDGQSPPEHRTMLAIGEGVIAAAFWTGALEVFGRTPASIQPALNVSGLYPAPGDAVRVDLAGTRPGTLEAEMEFRADWGDGTVNPWQDSPVFEHGFGQPGDYGAVFQVRNSAGQVSSEALTVHVGGTPPSAPSEPNVIETAFHRENQDLTFGILGIVLALAGGAIAVFKTRQKRSRLQRELAAIERAYDLNRSRPSDCEAALTERRAHVQGLALDGALDEGQVALLERRIEDLRRQLRLGALDDRFQFLPYGMVVRLREMLDDGVISTWEREHVMRALDDDDVLTKKQKGKVRDLVDSWFQRDAGVET